MMRTLALLCTLSVTAMGVTAQERVTVQAVVETQPLFNYEDAPATPDADDPAIWVNHQHPSRSLVIGTAKDAGLLVYDLSGHLVQALLPPNAPEVTSADPATPGGLNDMARPCTDSESGETFGRYNNVDIAYGVRLGTAPGAPRVDVAVVSDRGCDRIRFFRIDPSSPAAPLVDITSPAVSRVFPTRYDQPSPFQPSGAVEGWTDNPLDDQNTVYGLAVVPGVPSVFVTQRERGVVRQLQIVPGDAGTLGYQVVRTFVVDTTFDLRDDNGLGYAWTPCREAVEEEPQSEGVVFDAVTSTLYVAFETIGLYRVPLASGLPAEVRIGRDRLIEPLTSFGRSYRAIPDDDEFECEYEPEGDAGDGDIEVAGSDANAGRFLEADLEGLSIITSVPGQTILLASSQGDSSFHFYAINRDRPRHLGAFLVDGVGETDGVHYVPAAVTPRFPLGLLVVQNGEAPEPADTGDVNGFAFDGSTQFKFVDFSETLTAFTGRK
jgi:3-phytase